MHIRVELAAMKGYEPGEQPRGNEGIKLNTNENPYRASEKVYDAVAQACANGLARYPDPVATSFREKAAQCFGVEPDWIMCGNGSDDLLTILTRSFVPEKELLRLPYPSYILYKTLAGLQGAYAEMVHFNPDWSLPPKFTENPTLDLNPGELVRSERLRLVFLPNPNSPSGTMISPEQVLRIAQKLPCPLVVDEAYADFAEVSCIPLVKKCEKLIVVRTLSKAYALAGLRFGFLVAQPQLIEQLLKMKDSYNCDALSIAGATAAIADQDWLDENRRKIIATRDRLRERMLHLGFSIPPSFANFTWNTHSEIPLKPIYEFLKENGILVRYMNYPNWGDGLRISVGTDEQTDRCVDLITTWLEHFHNE